MNPELSAYLNVLRVFGALEVFASHMCIFGPACGFASYFGDLGSDGVVIFFVLSGYVIAYTADQKDRTVRRYFINRCARIYSVVVPALLLTLALEWAGTKWFPHTYNSIFDQYQFARIGLYIPLWLSFSSEFWGLNEPILTNTPFWSLCFEVWFYIVLALFLFTRGLSRIIAICAVVVLVGPKICIFFPLWGVGVLTYYLQQRITLTPWPARILLALSIASYPLLKILGLDDMATQGVNAAFHDWPRTHLQMAWQFPGYFPIALCIGGSILGMRFGALRQVARIAYPVGLAASFTFTIYLTHLPLLKFFVALAGPAIHSMLWPALATLACVVLLGSFTERRIGPWRSAFTLLVRCSDNLANRAAIAVRHG